MASPELTPGGRVAGDGGGGVHVVAHDHHRPADVAHVHERAEPDHLALVVAHLELQDVGHFVAKLLIGLDVDLPGPAELVEVVDVERAEIDLQRVEHVADGNAQGHALGAVHVEIQPGRVHAGTVRQSLQTRRPVAAIDELIGDALQVSESHVAAILDDELESARGSQTVDGRRAKAVTIASCTSSWQRRRMAAAMASALRLGSRRSAKSSSMTYIDPTLGRSPPGSTTGRRCSPYARRLRCGVQGIRSGP